MELLLFLLQYFYETIEVITCHVIVICHGKVVKKMLTFLVTSDSQQTIKTSDSEKTKELT